MGKLNAVRDIFKAEYQSLRNNLRQLVLTDFIRKDFQIHLGDNSAQFTQLGVLSYFESIRREIIEQSWTVPVAVLTGSLVIIPTKLAKIRELTQGASQPSPNKDLVPIIT